MLPSELVDIILEFKFHTFQLPYENVILYNKCLQELPRAKRKTRSNLKYTRYQAFEKKCYGYEPQDRIVYCDYIVNGHIDVVMCSIERF